MLLLLHNTVNRTLCDQQVQGFVSIIVAFEKRFHHLRLREAQIQKISHCQQVFHDLAHTKYNTITDLTSITMYSYTYGIYLLL